MANLRYDPFSEAEFDDLFRGFFQSIRFEGRTQAAARIQDGRDRGLQVLHRPRRNARRQQERCPAAKHDKGRSRAQAGEGALGGQKVQR